MGSGGWSVLERSPIEKGRAPKDAAWMGLESEIPVDWSKTCQQLECESTDSFQGRKKARNVLGSTAGGPAHVDLR
jgi:hypothetical protein